MENEALGQFLGILRSAVGTPYLFPLDPVNVPDDISGGVNCSGLFNWARKQMDLDLPLNFTDEQGILRSGLGTMGYARFLENRVDFDSDTLYPGGPSSSTTKCALTVRAIRLLTTPI